MKHVRAVVLLACLATAAHADPRVVIVETSDAPSLASLATQIRVYAGRVEVATVARPETSAAFAGRASEVVRAEKATAVVWIARSTDGYLVFAAGRRPDRALIELVRIVAPTPVREAERTIALKVAALLDTLLREPTSVGAVLGVPPARARTSWWTGIEGSLVRELGDRGWGGRSALYAEHRWQRDDRVFGARVGVRWQPLGVIEGGPGRVLVQELGGDAAASIAKDFGGWAPFVGGRLTGAARHARGITNDGRSHAATVFVPVIGLDVGVRRRLSSAAEVTVGVETDFAAIHQRFLLDGTPTADLGRLRIAFAGGLVVGL